MNWPWLQVGHSRPILGASDSYPFGPGARVLKVGGKIFALIGEGEAQLTLNLKCDPEDALAQRSAGCYGVKEKTSRLAGLCCLHSG